MRKNKRKCPRCGSGNTEFFEYLDDVVKLYVCLDCDHEFKVKETSSRVHSLDDEDDIDDIKEYYEDIEN